MPLRDTNNVQGAMNAAASMGRGGDDQMAHVGTGEIVIPAEVVDNNPNILAPLIKAFQKVGIDWRRYLVGDNNSTNPQTGAPEFFAAGGIGSSGRDTAREARERDPSRSRDTMRRIHEAHQRAALGQTGLEFSPETGGRGTAETYGADMSRQITPDRADIDKAMKYGGLIGGVGGLLTGGIPGAFAGYAAGKRVGGYIGGIEEDPYGRTPSELGPDVSQRDVSQRDHGVTPTLTQAPTTYAPQARPTPPAGLFPAGMSDLQQRARVATYGVSSPDIRYQTQDVQDYYKALAAEAVSKGEELLPIEKQYLEQVLGTSIPGDTQELIRLLGGTPQTAGGGEAMAGSGSTRGANISALSGF